MLDVYPIITYKYFVYIFSSLRKEVLEIIQYGFKDVHTFALLVTTAIKTQVITGLAPEKASTGLPVGIDA